MNKSVDEVLEYKLDEVLDISLSDVQNGLNYIVSNYINLVRGLSNKSSLGIEEVRQTIKDCYVNKGQLNEVLQLDDLRRILDRSLSKSTNPLVKHYSLNVSVELSS